MTNKSTTSKQADKAILVFRVKSFCEGFTNAKLQTVIDTVQSILDARKQERSTKHNRDN